MFNLEVNKIKWVVVYWIDFDTYSVVPVHAVTDEEMIDNPCLIGKVKYIVQGEKEPPKGWKSHDAQVLFVHELKSRALEEQKVLEDRENEGFELDMGSLTLLDSESEDFDDTDEEQENSCIFVLSEITLRHLIKILTSSTFWSASCKTESLVDRAIRLTVLSLHEENLRLKKKLEDLKKEREELLQQLEELKKEKERLDKLKDELVKKMNSSLK